MTEKWLFPARHGRIVSEGTLHDLLEPVPLSFNKPKAKCGRKMRYVTAFPEDSPPESRQGIKWCQSCRPTNPLGTPASS